MRIATAFVAISVLVLLGGMCNNHMAVISTISFEKVLLFRTKDLIYCATLSR